MRAIFTALFFVLTAFVSFPVFADDYDTETRLRSCFERLGDNAALIRDALTDNGLPVSFIYLVCAESGGKVDAVSDKGAVGLWQLMPATARTYGLTVNRKIDERLDAAKSTRAAVAYLAHLSAFFQGDMPWIIAAYNAGGHNILRAVGGYEKGMRIGIIQKTFPAAYNLAVTVTRMMNAPVYGLNCDKSALTCAPNNQNPGCEDICPDEVQRWCMNANTADHAQRRDVNCY